MGGHCPVLQELIVQIHLPVKARSSVVSPEAQGSENPGHCPGDGHADIQGVIAPSLPWGSRFRIKWRLVRGRCAHYPCLLSRRYLWTPRRRPEEGSGPREGREGQRPNGWQWSPLAHSRSTTPWFTSLHPPNTSFPFCPLWWLRSAWMSREEKERTGI